MKGHVPETIAAIKARAVPLAGQAGSNCGGNYTTGPNNDWGMGTIDANALILPLLQGTISGTVVAARTETPLAGAMITAGAYTTTSGKNGAYSLDVRAGTYTVTAQKGGYALQSKPGIVVTAGGTTQTNFVLRPTSPVPVNGVVRDGTSGGHTYPLYAKITFTTVGLPPLVTFTDPFSGAYSVALMQNASYTATIAPTLPGYPVTMVDFIPTTNPYTRNFTRSSRFSRLRRSRLFQQ